MKKALLDQEPEKVVLRYLNEISFFNSEIPVLHLRIVSDEKVFRLFCYIQRVFLFIVSGSFGFQICPRIPFAAERKKLLFISVANCIEKGAKKTFLFPRNCDCCDFFTFLSSFFVFVGYVFSKFEFFLFFF